VAELSDKQKALRDKMRKRVRETFTPEERKHIAACLKDYIDSGRCAEDAKKTAAATLKFRDALLELQRRGRERKKRR
jgi:hypothetical protein